jgi:hypothetical protein
MMNKQNGLARYRTKEYSLESNLRKGTGTPKLNDSYNK